MAMRYKITKESFATKIATYAAIGALAFMTYGVVSKVNSIFNERKYEKNASIVREAMAKRDYRGARDLIQKFRSGALRTEDERTLTSEAVRGIERQELAAKKKKGIVELETSFQYGAEKANLVFEKLKATGLYNTNEIVELGKKIGDSIESTLYDKAMRADATNLVTVAQEYLRLYPQGKNRTPVAARMIDHKIIQFENGLKSDMDFDSVNRGLESLVGLVNEHLKDNVIPNKARTDSLAETIKGYISTNSVADLAKPLAIGDNVLVRKVDKSGLAESYTSERNTLIPIGSCGRIIAETSDYSIVRFNSLPNLNWKNNYNSLEEHWKDGKKNVAYYKYSELVGAPRVSSWESNLLRDNVRKIARSIEVPHTQAPGGTP